MSDDDWLDDSLSGDHLPSAPPEQKERAIQKVCAQIAAATAQREAPPPRREPLPPPARSGNTLLSQRTWNAGDAQHGNAPVAANDMTPPSAQGTSLPKVVQAPPELAGTGLAVERPIDLWAMPFTSPPPPRPQPKRAPKTAQSRVYGLDPGQTAPLDDDSIARAVAAVLPFPAPLPPLPPLTLRQYACLCADLALRPEQSSETLRRYHVHGDAARAVLDAHWNRERAARPEARAAFEEDFTHYTAWLRAQRA